MIKSSQDAQTCPGSPAASAAEESAATLAYAARAASVRTRGAAPRVDPAEAAAAALRREVLLLRAENVYLRGQLASGAGGAGGGGAGGGGVGGAGIGSIGALGGGGLSGAKTPGGSVGGGFSLLAAAASTTPGSMTPVRSKLLLSSSSSPAGAGLVSLDEWGSLGSGVFPAARGGGDDTERPPSPSEEGRREEGAVTAPPSPRRTGGDNDGGGEAEAEGEHERRRSKPHNQPLVLAPRALARHLAEARAMAARFAADNAELAAESRALKARRDAVNQDYRLALEEVEELRERMGEMERREAASTATAATATAESETLSAAGGGKGGGKRLASGAFISTFLHGERIDPDFSAIVEMPLSNRWAGKNKEWAVKYPDSKDVQKLGTDGRSLIDSVAKRYAAVEDAIFARGALSPADFDSPEKVMKMGSSGSSAAAQVDAEAFEKVAHLPSWLDWFLLAEFTKVTKHAYHSAAFMHSLGDDEDARLRFGPAWSHGQG